MARMIPQKATFERQTSGGCLRRTYIPTGEIGEFAETGLTRWVNFNGKPGSYNIGKEFTECRVRLVIRKTSISCRKD